MKLGVGATRERPDLKEPKICMSLEQILRGVPRTYVELRDRMACIVAAYFFPRCQFAESSVILYIRRKAASVRHWPTYRALLEDFIKDMELINQNGVIDEVGDRFVLGLITGCLPDDIGLMWKLGPNPVDFSSVASLIVKLQQASQQVSSDEIENESLGRAVKKENARVGIQVIGGDPRLSLILLLPLLDLGGCPPGERASLHLSRGKEALQRQATLPSRVGGDHHQCNREEEQGDRKAADLSRDREEVEEAARLAVDGGVVPVERAQRGWRGGGEHPVVKSHPRYA
uniref:Uncharacterized protein n=1 Tax=Chromera velia CCMP2878 TaxID=1169474 RepID=A0A0G4GMD9_9ALVE|eukprot:Cvel_22540.t1-p1 / transcript=Cvel_22540.t1 / gene=Cvel_22540 / organism=Chromera_velia_CCMP2878 / gene_product=hypothetical protein / transcript_product=hypothetical protein / location=Cvel_scaffold2225:9133-11180(-) / protein_length=286 / sequence_SO=supercontig / SO=protein_coding / is_pseudo=false